MSEDSTASLGADLRATLAQIRTTVISTAQLVGRVGARLDAFSLELARDIGVVTRDARAVATAARDQATTVKRATPRTIKLARTGAAILGRKRWLDLQAAARGDKLRPEDHRELAHRVTVAAAELRGGIAKLGQLASCRPDLIGPIWATELATLQDEVPPIDAALIRARIVAELGKPIDELFATFDDVPIAAASLAQVHAATLFPDTAGGAGTRVVVKVQVPGIEDVIEADIAALRVMASAIGEVPGMDLATLVGELSRALATELDYVAEADALWSFSTTAIIPKVIADRSSRRVLTMSRIDGEKLIPALDAMTPEVRDRILGELVGEVAAQVLVRGQVHADPHPGNFLVTGLGGGDPKLAILDFGCTLQLDKAERAAYARLVLAIAGGSHAAAAAELATLGFSADDPDQLVALSASLIGAMRPGAAVSEIDWEEAFATQLANAKQLGGLTIPRSFVLLGRVLATLAGLLAKYKPRIHLHPLIAGHLAKAIA